MHFATSLMTHTRNPIPDGSLISPCSCLVVSLQQAQLAVLDAAQGDCGAMVHYRIDECLRVTTKEVAKLVPERGSFGMGLGINACQRLGLPDRTANPATERLQSCGRA